MANFNSSKQKIIIEDLLSSAEIYAKCASILKSDYFDAEYKPIVHYIHDYYSKYKGLPESDILKSEFDFDFEIKSLPRHRVEKTCDDIESFCQQNAIKDAFSHSLGDYESGDYGAIVERMQEAVLVSLKKDMGIEMYAEDAEERLRAMVDSFTAIPTLIKGIDEILNGGLIRQQITLISAHSGGGKSIMLSNIGRNYAIQGYNVLYISLELPEEMIYLRNAAIISGFDISEWQQNIPQVSESLLQEKKDGSGSYLLKRLSQNSTSNDIRSFITFYEGEFGCAPDVLLVDYLDLMAPNEGLKNLNVSEQDKRKAEQLTEILHDYNMIGVTASQENRGGLKAETERDQDIIAGGITKVNTVDNYISLYMNKDMRLQGEMMAFFLKTRSSKGVGKYSMLNFNPDNLRIGDPGGEAKVSTHTKKTDIEKLIGDNSMKSPVFVEGEVEGLPGVPKVYSDEAENERASLLFTDTELKQELPRNNEQPKLQPKENRKKSKGGDLIALMSSLNSDL